MAQVAAPTPTPGQPSALTGQPGSDPTARTGQNARYGRVQARMGLVFVSPVLILFSIFVILPAFAALYLSFTDYDILTPPEWVGLENYRRLLTDTLFHRSFQNILLYSAMYVPVMLILSILLAMALNRKRPGVTLFRAIYYLPVVTSPVAAATVWVWLLNRDFGVVNQLLAYVGIDGPAWLANTQTALISVVIVTLWQGIGGNMIIYLAGLQGVPQDLVEAARLDGASRLQVFRDVTWPMLRTTTLFVLTVTLIGAFQLFDQAYVMTQGGPGYATLTPVYRIYQAGFTRLDMGYASSQALILFIVILAVTLIQLRINREQIYI
ncbi:MAG TPA: sugar ABC transporter permease [Thermomicrobiales bacterium]|jgi:multiple sugar transport system permease protein|nr:sugar ABC transporter permease [Thermomicrobiales bacterium]